MKELIRTDYTSPTQSTHAALRFDESVATVKMLEKSLNYLNVSFYLEKSSNNLLK